MLRVTCYFSFGRSQPIETVRGDLLPARVDRTSSHGRLATCGLADGRSPRNWPAELGKKRCATPPGAILREGARRLRGVTPQTAQETKAMPTIVIGLISDTHGLFRPSIPEALAGVSHHPARR